MKKLRKATYVAAILVLLATIVSCVKNTETPPPISPTESAPLSPSTPLSPSIPPSVDFDSPDGFFINADAIGIISGIAWNPVSGDMISQQSDKLIIPLQRNTSAYEGVTIFQTAEITVKFPADGSCVFTSSADGTIVFDDVSNTYEIEGHSVTVAGYGDFRVSCLTVAKTDFGFTAAFALRGEFIPDDAPISEQIGQYLFVASFHVQDMSITWSEPIRTSDQSVFSRMTAGGADGDAITLIDNKIYFADYASAGSIDLQTGTVEYLTKISDFVDTLVPDSERPKSESPQSERFLGYVGNLLVYAHDLIADGSAYYMQYALRGGDLIGVCEIGSSEIKTFDCNGILLRTYDIDDFI